MKDKGMFRTKCAYPGCEKIVFAYAKNKMGDLPVVYCSKEHESNAKYDRKFKKI